MYFFRVLTTARKSLKHHMHLSYAVASNGDGKAQDASYESLKTTNGSIKVFIPIHYVLRSPLLLLAYPC